MNDYQGSPLKFRVFAKYREALGFCEKSLTPPPEVVNIQALIEWLLEEEPGWSEVLMAPDKLIALNQTLVNLEANFKPGDEIALLPPVTGG